MEQVVASGTDTALYLFGFVSAPAGGVDPIDDDLGSAVMLIGVDTVALAAGVVRAGDYEPPPDSGNPADRIEWVAPLALRHHDIVRRLHAARTVVPLKFGALCPDVDHAVTLVRRLCGPIAALLERFDGKDEWTLKVSADRGEVAGALQSARPGLIRLEKNAEEMPAGAAYFARKRLQQLLADLIAEECAVLEQRVWARLAAAGVEIAPSAAGSAGSPDALAIANGALLVDRRQFADVERILDALESEYAAIGFRCELGGPWPPYSFSATLDVR